MLALLALESLSALAERLVGKPALGLGDAKLAAMGGAWLGLWGIALGIWLVWLMGPFGWWEQWQAALTPWLGL